MLWEEGSRQTQRGEEHENLHLPWSLSAASVSILCTLGRGAVYCKSCLWVKWNCGCTQTRSHKLLLIDLPLLHAAVELLLLLLLLKQRVRSCTWQLHLLHCWWRHCCFAETLAIALSLAPCNPRASQVDPNAIPSGASEVDPDAISLPTEQRYPKLEILRIQELTRP